MLVNLALTQPRVLPKYSLEHRRIHPRTGPIQRQIDSDQMRIVCPNPGYYITFPCHSFEIMNETFLNILIIKTRNKYYILP